MLLDEAKLSYALALAADLNQRGEIVSASVVRQLVTSFNALLAAGRANVGSATPEWCDCSEAGERGKCRHMLLAVAIRDATGERVNS